MHAIPAQEVAGHCLQAFTQLVPASQAAFYCVDRQLQARDFRLQGMSGEMHRDYLDNYRQFDPLQPRNCLSSGLAVVPLGFAMARQPLRDSRRYQDFLQRYGVVDVVEIVAHRADQPQAAISLLRTAEQGVFTPDQLAQLNALQALLQMAVANMQPCDDALAGLTPKERQIAWLLRQGASNKQLALELDVGLPTIKTHLIHLFRKTGVSSRTELVAALFL
ncbi:LuxR C-terminal-related transcriptional regulator [Pseudomonas marginalis]|jgi:DNA-binding CsgD family transcriptional regulator|uniref:DNA-binding CsgD family transcriptional regulator n=2 Tax=Pseudomonas fluorescens group TaxID=136843 RepID=A0A7Z1GXV8_9PSED|nr:MULTISPECIES: LuxR C-terminal-related transcriptional regulator [Pseudomonas]MDT9633581.1 LuxR family transcriptional regulator [Pseudomonas sp. JV449]NMZ94584.1 LuxR family transcriptional regulator [Pseudomonas marginalis]PFG72468.1 DNA-binding CsgD family transcriptional regulator [Pseudomonas poae]PUB40708.1 DNA-binding CsgD family transcriptional regulator [Pseudomonas sp. GV047]TKJ74164.1 LuxR family transcriptional regulator [Pseudomonas sp. CFBP13509]